MHHIWLRVVSASGRHQGAHIDITCTNTVCGWALVPPASVAHCASGNGLVTDCVDGVSFQLLCRGGLPRPPAVTTCLSCFQCARVVGASRSCRSRRYTLSSLLSVATLSSPGPRAQHPTSHRVGRLVTDDLAFDGNEFCVGADRCVRPHRETKRILAIKSC